MGCSNNASPFPPRYHFLHPGKRGLQYSADLEFGLFEPEFDTNFADRPIEAHPHRIFGGAEHLTHFNPAVTLGIHEQTQSLRSAEQCDRLLHLGQKGIKGQRVRNRGQFSLQQLGNLIDALGLSISVAGFIKQCAGHFNSQPSDKGELKVVALDGFGEPLKCNGKGIVYLSAIAVDELVQ